MTFFLNVMHDLFKGTTKPSNTTEYIQLFIEIINKLLKYCD